MRVLLVSSGSGSRGGGEIFLDYLGKGLAERGHEVLMWIPNHARMDELAVRCAQFAHIFRAEYRNTYDYPARSLSTCFNWGVSRRVAREWEALRPDIIHINKQNLEDGLDLLRAVRRCALPSVCTIHLTQTASYFRARVGWLRDWIARWQLGKYNGVLVAVQEHRCAMLRDFLTARVRTKTIFNGVPRVDRVALRGLREAKRKELGLGDGDLLVLGVGRLVEQKRPLLFLRIAQKLHTDIPSIRFRWVGDGELADRWQATVSSKRLEGIASCTGWQADVLPFLLAGDLLLHVAEFEGLPFVVIEAMAAQLPCAVTRDLASEIPLFSEANVLFADDVQNLVEKLKDPPSLRRVTEGAGRLVENEFSAKKMAESYEQLYLNVRQERSTLAVAA
jgi:glycosyltransferase involved in cell wall biosynthesis